ncbi:hypothetical protein D5S18_25260 [Nocardia panacis]|uniref:CbtA family protein n=1 Tax=Nocardia panacis TaxID=2340916 RepID=A0A3A4K1A9_9NOCA|nr:CbtA family protein [Nocardia panacis]RJO71222.1 hypothetical protein D5S18_25260 [Nocardia panacis]
MPLTGPLRTLLLRGLLAGLIAGLLAATVGFTLGEPKVDAAIAIEEAHSATESGGHTHEGEPLVSRTGQKAGQFLALGLAGLALGALFGTAAHFARRHTALPGPKLALLLGLGGWAAIVAVPFFKYPANPPAVGEPDTINQRTLLWFAAVLLGFAAVGAGVYLFKVLRAQRDTVRLSAGVAAFLVIVAVGYILLPGINEVKSDFPATLLWQFRAVSLGETATLWAALALGFAVLTDFASGRDTAVRAGITTAV